MSELKYCTECQCCWDRAGRRAKGAIPTYGKPRKVCPHCKERIKRMNGFIIEKNVPLVPRNNERKYPFHMMKVGDSFLIKSQKDMSRVSSTMRSHCKRHKRKKFTLRKVGENQWRCWRLK